MTHGNSPINVRLINGGELKLSELPPRSVALDGAVRGPVMGDAQDRWSFDHHDGVVRFLTDATCLQVYRSLVQGFDWSGRDVYVNDLDGDTVLSLWMLTHQAQVHEPRVLQLVRTVAAIDSHGPAGALELTSEERALSSTFFSTSVIYCLPQNLQEKFSEWPALLATARERIDKLVAGGIEVAPARTPEVKILQRAQRGTLDLVLAQCPDPSGFGELYRQGADVVCLTGPAADGSTRYTVGKCSDLVRYPLGSQRDEGTLLYELNTREPGWGGGSSVGGSPRLAGGVSSRLSPEALWEIMLSRVNV